MTDYGHDLRFGTFITPSNAHPDTPVALAQLSENLGFDLVTFQDHPYQPAFLDTWTLLSWVAARTEKIHLSGNVLNLPLRPPAVLARAAASLDLLSRGRFELGLGAGGFWDAVGAMGGRQLTPGQGVDALSEAIDVIRGIWDVHERSVLRVPGEYYHLDGAKRGPATPHEIPIWLGALKPRMLRLIGRKADGWLPSLMYLKPGALQLGNQTIDTRCSGCRPRPPRNPQAGQHRRNVRRAAHHRLHRSGLDLGRRPAAACARRRGEYLHPRLGRPRHASTVCGRSHARRARAGSGRTLGGGNGHRARSQSDRACTASGRDRLPVAAGLVGRACHRAGGCALPARALHVPAWRISRTRAARA